MLVSGIHFKLVDTQCVIPVFPHQLTGEVELDTVFIGNTFMQDYYVVYDMSPLSTYKLDYIQIGIALQNTDNQSLKR